MQLSIFAWLYYIDVKIILIGYCIKWANINSCNWGIGNHLFILSLMISYTESSFKFNIIRITCDW